MNKVLSHCRYMKGLLFALFMLAGSALVAQNAPEMMYFKFDVPGTRRRLVTTRLLSLD